MGEAGWGLAAHQSQPTTITFCFLLSSKGCFEVLSFT